MGGLFVPVPLLPFYQPGGSRSSPHVASTFISRTVGLRRAAPWLLPDLRRSRAIYGWLHWAVPDFPIGEGDYFAYRALRGFRAGSDPLAVSTPVTRLGVWVFASPFVSLL